MCVPSEIITLKQRLSEAQVPTSKMREYLIRALYIEMLGHDSSFAYIHAVKMTQDKNLLCKRIGYLACSLCLDNEHELLLLLINTIQKVRLLPSHSSCLQLTPARIHMPWAFHCSFSYLSLFSGFILSFVCYSIHPLFILHFFRI